ncbi:hypothetical protein SDC9_148124 [bioreactor metagenome]|uniref:Uncharacterized protein n=1 Tax=bioreactor metagenome TaxID=1076179 RepID=A0A645EHK1_9ZZZZ
MLVIPNKEKVLDDILEKYPQKVIIDLVRAWNNVDYNGYYEGLSWANLNQNEGQNMKIERDMPVMEF